MFITQNIETRKLVAIALILRSVDIAPSNLKTKSDESPNRVALDDVVAPFG